MENEVSEAADGGPIAGTDQTADPATDPATDQAADAPTDAGADAADAPAGGASNPKYSLQQYLDKEYAGALAANKLGAQPADDSKANLHVPISIFAHVKTGGNHHYAGIHDDEVHFSASMMKVAAMFAAFSLRAEARTLATGGSYADENAFFKDLAQKFDSKNAVAAIRNAKVGLTPRYKDILKVTGFGGAMLSVDFLPVFSTHMKNMIVPSNNTSASECIRRLGYAYINVKLMDSGFYESASSTGIWLAGDFAGGTRVEIDSVNDGKSAQATTSRQMAKLFSLIALSELIDADSSSEMADLLNQAQKVDKSWISRSPNPKFGVIATKIGLANLKPNEAPLGPDVYSEGVILQWNGDQAALDGMNLTGELTVCWQNLRVSAFKDGVPAISGMISTAFTNFLYQSPV